MRRSFLRPFRLLAVLGLLGASVAVQVPVSAATLAATTTCGNSADNTGGLGVICEVTISNTITASGGSASVTVRECHGAAGDPEAACTTETQVLTQPVTVVDQCNDAENGGGGTVRCSVRITNDFVEEDPAAVGVTVNQCVGSGDGITTGCDPFPATTTGATITQCNGSANGGTLVGLTCTATGTQSTAFSVTVNQCNGTGNGGGALVICSAEIETTFGAPTPAPTTAAPTPAPTTAAPTPAPTSAALTRGAPTPPATDGAPSDTMAPAIGNGWALATIALVFGALVTVGLARRRATVD